MRTGKVLLSGMGGACIFLLLSGCNPQDAQHISQDTRQLAQHTGQALGSASLAGKVNMVLSLRKGVDMSGLHVEAQDSTVTLGGHVRNAEEKARVEETVQNIRGVDKVINNLRVQP